MDDQFEMEMEMDMDSDSDNDIERESNLIDSQNPIAQINTPKAEVKRLEMDSDDDISSEDGMQMDMDSDSENSEDDIERADDESVKEME